MSKILIVEDDSLLGEFFKTSLLAAGFEADYATLGKEGLDRIGLENPDLVLLDILLPDISGFEILRRLKKGESTKDIPVVVVSNLGDQESVERAMDYGAEHFFVKANVLPKDIIAKVQEILDKRATH